MSWSLFLRNFIFTVLQPGTVTILIPFFLLKSEEKTWPRHFEWVHGLSGIVCCVGLFVLLDCIFQFGKIGRGTLSPVDPTQNLVISKYYRVTRNPMYLAVLSILISESVFYHSYILLIYSIAVFAIFHAFILFHEEPRLLRVFGQKYELYKKTVPRWLW